MKETLSAKQIEAIKALIKYPTVKEAAEASGNPIRTLQRWLTQPEFLDALHQVQKNSFEEAGYRVINSTIEAAEAITDIMRNPTQPGANMKLKAATAILELGVKYHKSMEQDERLNRLEEKAGYKDTTRIARLEDHYCKMIVENYMKSPEYELMATIDGYELDYLDHELERDPSLIELLTYEERVKYDMAFARRQRRDKLIKKKEALLRAEIEKKRKDQKGNEDTNQRDKQVNPPDPPDVSENESSPAPPDKDAEIVTIETQSDVTGNHPSIITDEDLKESVLDRINRRTKEHDENNEQGNLEEDEDNKQYWEPEEDD